MKPDKINKEASIIRDDAALLSFVVCVPINFVNKNHLASL